MIIIMNGPADSLYTGELTPQYRDLLLPSILCGCRHQDPLTRASCLSGLAEVCQLLRFSLGPVLYEASPSGSTQAYRDNSLWLHTLSVS